eukprot:6342380-Amphidinium_carterae.3
MDQNNVINYTGVLKWKWTKDKSKCRARLCLRGFKDKQRHELNTYASTASHISQRIICSLVAVYSDMQIAHDSGGHAPPQVCTSTSFGRSSKTLKALRAARMPLSDMHGRTKTPRSKHDHHGAE